MQSLPVSILVCFERQIWLDFHNGVHWCYLHLIAAVMRQFSPFLYDHLKELLGQALNSHVVPYSQQYQPHV